MYYILNAAIKMYFSSYIVIYLFVIINLINWIELSQKIMQIKQIISKWISKSSSLSGFPFKLINFCISTVSSALIKLKCALVADIHVKRRKKLSCSSENFITSCNLIVLWLMASSSSSGLIKAFDLCRNGWVCSVLDWRFEGRKFNPRCGTRLINLSCSEIWPSTGATYIFRWMHWNYAS